MDRKDYIDLTADADAGCHQWPGWHRTTTGMKNETPKRKEGAHD
jgi:hypothetical protein